MTAQFEQLKARHPAATREPLSPSNSALITIPGFALPEGWNKAAVTLRFIEPSGYPFAAPDCFWCDSDLRLASGKEPQNTGANAIPETPLTNLLWFSWHVNNNWSPNRDNLLTWAACITNRFRQLQ